MQLRRKRRDLMAAVCPRRALPAASGLRVGNNKQRRSSSAPPSFCLLRRKRAAVSYSLNGALPAAHSNRTGRGKAQGDTSFAWSRQESGGRPRWLWPAPGGGGNGGGAAATQQGAALSFWPLLPGFEGGDTVDLELRGDPAGLLADTQVTGWGASRQPCWG